MNKKEIKDTIIDLKMFILLWITQAFSSLGSSMTSFALVIWSYEEKKSALTTSLLTICSYAPYVILSIFAGTLSDKFNKKKVMLMCDSIAALSSVVVLVLLHVGQLKIYHLYILNAINGFMNSIEQPASDVATSLLVKEKYYQKVSGMKSLTNSITTLLTPIIATCFLTFAGTDIVIAFDLLTFIVAFITLAFFIKIPDSKIIEDNNDTLLKRTKSGIAFLNNNKGILELILFLAGVNFIASIYNAALPAMFLSRNGGSKTALGAENAFAGIANILGSIYVTISKKPKSRVKVICNSLLFSLSTENFLLAFGRSTPIWCIGAFLGWVFIPVMAANMDVLLRSNIKVEMQGRVYAVRNSFQFFTIPLGYLLGGFLVDYVFEPFMASMSNKSILIKIFGRGKGTGAALLFFVIGILGSLMCLLFRRCKLMWNLDKLDTLKEKAIH